jgi:hypothetical protein
MIRVLVCGGRNFDNRAMLYATLDRLHAARGFTVVVAGGARGADTLAVEWAKQREVKVEVYLAEWDRLRRKAGPIRNQRMLDEQTGFGCCISWRPRNCGYDRTRQ